MIIIHTTNISIELKNNLNDFILQSFEKSRIDDYTYFIYCKNNGIIIGFVGLYYINNYLSINQLCVHPNHRNRGVASSILNFIKKIYKSSRLILYVDKNKSSTNYLHDFYLKHGFNDIIDNKDLPYDYENEFLMELKK
jgi:N-acetylglutamate synthase-like GNAT family acetyltransferase